MKSQNQLPFHTIKRIKSAPASPRGRLPHFQAFAVPRISPPSPWFQRLPSPTDPSGPNLTPRPPSWDRELSGTLARSQSWGLRDCPGSERRLPLSCSCTNKFCHAHVYRYNIGCAYKDKNCDSPIKLRTGSFWTFCLWRETRWGRAESKKVEMF